MLVLTSSQAVQTERDRGGCKMVTVVQGVADVGDGEEARFRVERHQKCRGR